MSFFYLVRLRVNPEKICIKVRRDSKRGMWRVEMISLVAPRSVIAHHKYPTRALALALRLATRADFPGVDLGMGWAYDHPQGALAYAAQAPGSHRVTRHNDEYRKAIQ